MCAIVKSVTEVESSGLIPKFRKSLQNPPESPWFDWIACGKKCYEGRLWKDEWASLSEGDIITFVCPAKRELTCRVIALPRFESFGAAFIEFGSELVPVPGVNTTDVINIYGQYYKDEDVKRYGVVAIHVEPISLIEVQQREQYDNYGLIIKC
jgi:ASC-1-like (ASCH) protein